MEDLLAVLIFVISFLFKRLLVIAEEMKQEGNEHFRGKRWNEALATYRSALGHLPKRKPKIVPPTSKGKEKAELDEVDVEKAGKDQADSDTKTPPEDASTATPEPEPTPLELECAKARATLSANIGACYVKLVGCMLSFRSKLANTLIGRA